MTAEERLEQFREVKYSLYDKTNNMDDINRMFIWEFYRILDYYKIKNTSQQGGFVPLNKRQKRMIEEAKKDG